MTVISDQLTVNRQENKQMSKRTHYCLLITILLITGPAEAQQPKKVPRVGWLFSVSASSAADRVEAFRQGLRELGYVEGKNIVIEYRYAESKLDRLPALAAEFVRLKVDVIVTSNQEPTRSAKTTTVTIPIVMARDTDPIGNGFVASLDRRAAILRVCRAWHRR